MAYMSTSGVDRGLCVPGCWLSGSLYLRGLMMRVTIRITIHYTKAGHNNDIGNSCNVELYNVQII